MKLIQIVIFTMIVNVLPHNYFGIQFKNKITVQKYIVGNFGEHVQLEINDDFDSLLVYHVKWGDENNREAKLLFFEYFANKFWFVYDYGVDHRVSYHNSNLGLEYEYKNLAIADFVGDRGQMYYLLIYKYGYHHYISQLFIQNHNITKEPESFSVIELKTRKPEYLVKYTRLNSGVSRYFQLKDRRGLIHFTRGYLKNGKLERLLKLKK